MNGVGGRVRFCEVCFTARCIAPHTKCSRCRPRAAQERGPTDPEVAARRNRRRTQRRRAVGVLASFESW